MRKIKTISEFASSKGEKKITIEGREARKDLGVHIPPKHTVCPSVIHDKNRNCSNAKATKPYTLKKHPVLEILPLAYSNSTYIHPLVSC